MIGFNTVSGLVTWVLGLWVIQAAVTVGLWLSGDLDYWLAWVTRTIMSGPCLSGGVTQTIHQIQCSRASIFDVTPPTRACGTLLAPAQFHNRDLSLSDPHTWQAPAQNAALLEESTSIGLAPSEWRGECPENGALEPRSHGTFLHVARQMRRQPSQLHYITTGPSQCPRIDKPHTASIAWTRPAVARRLQKVVTQVVWDCPLATNWYKLHFFRILWIGIKYRIGFCGRACIQLANQLIPTSTKVNLVWLPKWISCDYESTIVSTWRPNHNKVQSVAAVEWFRRERVAVNPLHIIVHGVAKHQTVV